MQPDAPLTRRAFLQLSLTTGGSLLIAACAAPAPRPGPTASAAPTATQPRTPTPAPTAVPTSLPPFQANLFIQIDLDGAVSLTVHRSEMGQGVRTALAMILADELEADWSTVRILQAPASSHFGSQTTSGSGTIAGSYDALRQAGAAARELLVAAAAGTWGVAPADCQARSGAVLHPATGRRLGYGELVPAARALPLPTDPALKDPKEFRLIGMAVPRVDGPAIVTGRATFGLDVRLPGMLFAAVARCPVPGGTLAGYDASAAQSVPGVRKVVKVPSGVAVVAENTWAAFQGRAALRVTWTEGSHAALSSDSIHQTLVDAMTQALKGAGDEPQGLTTLDAVYETPYFAHAALEPINCAADVRADACDIWAPTQNPQAVQQFVRNAIGLPTEVHVTLLGGGFGRRLEVDFAIEAAAVSKAAGSPVQVVWTRDDDLQHDFYRQPTYHALRAGWDRKGTLAFWRHYVAGPGLNGLAYRVGRDVLEEGLAMPYDIATRSVEGVLATVPLPTGPWRAVVSGPNAFASESFLDEVAAALKQDPYILRMALLPQDNPLRPVLELAAAKAGWGSPLPAGRGRGLACHNTYNQTPVAMVAEVSVENGAPRVHKVVCAVECGRVIQPDMVAQQMEGGIVFGLTSLLKAAITWDRGRVQQSNFDNYPILTLPEMPVVEVHLLASERPPRGVGEMAVPPIVPAVANALFAVTGKRIRRLPVQPADL
jgi:isoquinoline 1-oxidoreductase beta subunit